MKRLLLLGTLSCVCLLGGRVAAGAQTPSPKGDSFYSNSPQDPRVLAVRLEQAVDDLHHALAIELQVFRVDDGAEEAFRRGLPLVEQKLPKCADLYKQAHALVPRMQQAFVAKDVKTANALQSQATALLKRADDCAKDGLAAFKKDQGKPVVKGQPPGTGVPPPPGADAPPRPRYPRSGRAGAVRYFIDGLGTDHVVAWAEPPGKQAPLSADVQARSNGEKRAFRPEEQSFDKITGLQWNWVGSSRSGGKTVLPGGIGDVNVGFLNDFDRAARKHDIQSWLQANFEQGADVSLLINGTRTSYTVKSFLAVTQDVTAEFWQATDAALARALQQAQAAGNQADVARITALQKDRQGIDRFRVLQTVLTDKYFAPFLGPPGR
jgi:hypothetical protein